MGTETFTLELPQHQTAIAAAHEHTLLHSLLAADQPWTSSCRNGSCRSCLGRLEAGTVRYSIAWPGLSADEKAEGLVLPCVAHPASDIRLRFVGL